jgi:hypothetical protein
MKAKEKFEKLTTILESQLEKLVARKIDLDEAKGTAALAKQLNNTYSLQADVAKFIVKEGDAAKGRLEEVGL